MSTSGFFGRWELGEGVGAALEEAQEQVSGLSAAQQAELLGLLSGIGLSILEGARGPMPLMAFGKRVVERLGYAPPVPLPHFSMALKRIIQGMGDERLRVMAPSEMLGVGYVYNAGDPETWPVRHMPTIPAAACE